MNRFVRELITEWRRLELPGSGTVVVGVSGGADSVALLLAIHELVNSKKLALRLVAAHFNHKLRDGEADADENFVRQLTKEKYIEFAAGRADGAATSDIEQRARVERYQFLTQVAENVNAFAVLTAHTMNDQAETFLMNLVRGSGPEGLCGMRSVRPMEAEFVLRTAECSPAEPGRTLELDENGEPLLPFNASPLILVRPLLKWAKRGDTEDLCRSLGVDYRYDTMNEDTAFKRVRIRKVLLPLLADMNPRIVETLANTAHLMQLPRAGIQGPLPDELIIGEIASLDTGAARQTIREWLRQRRGNTRQLQLKHIEAIERLALSTKSGRVAEVPGGRIVKGGGRLRYQENKVEN